MFISLSQIKQELEQLSDLLSSRQKQYESLIEKAHASQKISAINLLHYLAFRSVDIRGLQQALHKQGYSSLTGAEGYTRSQIIAVLKHFGVFEEDACTFEASKNLLQARASELYGNQPGNTIPSIMVTLKTSHARDILAVKKLLRAGMNIARINCAHDDEASWKEMVLNVRKATEITNIPCKIYMDLAGPKLRTKIIEKKGRVLLEEGDNFYLSDTSGFKSKLPMVFCTIPGITRELKEGERVFFDDGLFEAKIVAMQPGVAELEVVRVSAKKPYLKNEKGINFPDSQLSLSALTDFDRGSLNFILQYADLVGYSFIHNANDLTSLQNEMEKKKIPIILKIETTEGYANLPKLLFKAMEEDCYGVMIARGDLAVEMGFEKISRIQEEISLLCTAAHAPVVWATQVLENMNKTGLASRSEVTDASIGVAAECVMLNKGNHTVKAIKALKTILKDGSRHHSKKKYLLSPLELAQKFFDY
jgi:pyruvate kinase